MKTLHLFGVICIIFMNKGEITTTELPSTPKSETTTPELETSTPEQETSTHEQETSTPEPETSTPEPETSTPEPETSTPEPETNTPGPEPICTKGSRSLPEPEQKLGEIKADPEVEPEVIYGILSAFSAAFVVMAVVFFLLWRKAKITRIQGNEHKNNPEV